ncbi:MAG: hypothetical protein Kow00105_01060 [Phycisphaeraceae bacterium]
MPRRKPVQPVDDPTPAEFRDASRGVRLHKAMADAGVASRRECEALIAEGRVRVNGHVVNTLPAWVDPVHDRITVDGEPIRKPSRKRRSAAKTYIMVNKPKRVISTNDDPEGRRRVIDLVDLPNKARLYPVGRLDAETTGLILLTDDGELTYRLTHPSFEIPKRYQVTVQGRFTEEDAEKLKKGLYLAHKGKPGGAGAKVKKAAAARIRILGHQTDRSRGDRTTISLTLTEGQNREIRRVLARLGYKVRALHRVAIGKLRLKGLAVGQWRPLTAVEVAMLYKTAGLSTDDNNKR